jgi:hypothetical protein
MMINFNEVNNGYDFIGISNSQDGDIYQKFEEVPQNLHTQIRLTFILTSLPDP